MEGLSHRFGTGPASERFGNRIEQGDPGFDVGRNDGVGDAVQRHSQSLSLVPNRGRVFLRGPPSRLFLNQAASVLLRLLARLCPS